MSETETTANTGALGRDETGLRPLTGGATC